VVDISPDTLERLRDDWLALVRPLGAGDAPARQVFDDLVVQYAGATRFYHTLGHIAEMLDTIDRLADGKCNRTALRLAAWFHDVVYDPHAADNEERSATRAEEVLSRLRLPRDTIRAVKDLILLTKTHQAEPTDADGRVLQDADLARLGAPPEQFAAYSQAIRREYAWVPEEEYRAGRRQLLQNFLGRERLFATDLMHREFEVQARQNLRDEIARLA
jgi:predicted metal-dependent HD superfamily phosphohydrolase